MTQDPVNAEKEKKKPGLAQVLVPVAVILALVLVALSVLRSRDDRAHHHASEQGGTAVGYFPRVGETLPDFELVPLEGKPRMLSSIDARVILINVWATWCGPCIAEMPSIVKLREQYLARGFEVVGINVDEDPGEILRPFEKRFGMNFVSYTDREGRFSDRFGVSSIPISIVVDADRKVLFAEPGDRDWYSDETRKKVEEWLAGSSR